MLKLCDLTITKPLSIIYKDCLQQGAFLDDWEKSSIILVRIKVPNSSVMELTVTSFKLIKPFLNNSS